WRAPRRHSAHCTIAWRRDRPTPKRWESVRALEELHFSRSGLDSNRPLPIPDPPREVVAPLTRDLQREIGLDVSTPGLDFDLGSERGWSLDRDVSRAGLDLELTNRVLEVRAHATAARFERDLRRAKSGEGDLAGTRLDGKLLALEIRPRDIAR